MKANIFLVDPLLGPEDRLTANWHYVLSVVPELGQAFVDHVSSRSGLSRSKFLGAIDHPTGDRANHPDLRIRCRDYDILFEHKLDSPLGLRQLHRYLDLAKTKGWKLALLAARRLEVDKTVCQSRLFVCPKGAGDPPHFLWQDVYRMVESSKAGIADEFKEYLKALGLGHFSWAGFGDPFTDEKAGEQLRSLYLALAPMFRSPGTSCRTRSNSLVYEIRRPFPPVHLFNILPLASVAEWDKRLWGRVMALSVYVRREGDVNRRLLPHANGYIRGSSPRVYVTDDIPVPPPHYDRCVYLELEYYVLLDEVLRSSKTASQDHLVAFVQTAVDHLQGRRALVRQQDA